MENHKAQHEGQDQDQRKQDQDEHLKTQDQDQEFTPLRWSGTFYNPEALRYT